MYFTLWKICNLFLNFCILFCENTLIKNIVNHKIYYKFLPSAWPDPITVSRRGNSSTLSQSGSSVLLITVLLSTVILPETVYRTGEQRDDLICGLLLFLVLSNGSDGLVTKVSYSGLLQQRKVRSLTQLCCLAGIQIPSLARKNCIFFSK